MSDFGFYSAKAFFEKKFESREPLIDQILYERDSIIIAGKAKTGKSVLIFQLICSLTSGKPFLDRFGVKRKCKVIYIQLEGSLSDSQDRFNRMLHALSLEQENFFIYFTSPLALNDSNTIKKLIHDIESQTGKIDVIIIDPLYFAMKGSLSNDEVVRDFAGNMRILQEHFKCTCILIHHFKKMQRDKNGNIFPPSDDDVFGSVFLQAWITHQFLFDIDKTSKARTLQCNIQRSGNIIEKLSLKMIEPDPLYYEELDSWPQKTETILKFFKAHPDQWMKSSEAFKMMKMAKSTFYREIEKILISNPEIKKRGELRDYEFGYFKETI